MKEEIGQNLSTKNLEYVERLLKISTPFYKRLLKPINPYRRNIRRLCSGRVLDIGCGFGRNLTYLNRANVFGVDHNPHAVALTQKLGFEAQLASDFVNELESNNDKFDTLLLSHVLEHLTLSEAREMIRTYLPALRAGGKIVIICPQEKGQMSDNTHVTFFETSLIRELLKDFKLVIERHFSFPLPRRFGKLFIYNESIVVGIKQ